MADQIAAKPTVYKRVTFHSRLEARWAVLLDYNPLVDAWAFEPLTLRYEQAGWDYTPDFAVKLGTISYHYLEIKPVIPTDDYIKLLALFSHYLPQGVDRLYLAYGSIYAKKAPPLICPMGIDIQTEAQVKKASIPLEDLYRNSLEALRTAQAYRFDLPERRPPFRTGGTTGPQDHLREYIKKEKAKSRQQAKERDKKKEGRPSDAADDKSNHGLM